MSRNVGAVLATNSLTGEWHLRELASHELKQFNTLCKVLELPVDHKQVLRAVGNCEPPRMAQAMARSVVGPWLESSRRNIREEYQWPLQRGWNQYIRTPLDYI